MRRIRENQFFRLILIIYRIHRGNTGNNELPREIGVFSQVCDVDFFLKQRSCRGILVSILIAALILQLPKDS